MMSSEVLTAKYFTSVNGRSVFVLHFIAAVKVALYTFSMYLSAYDNG